jgi:DNA-binding response OmpR family regulator
LIVTEAQAPTLQQQLSASGYETQTTAPGTAAATIGEFEPDVAIFVIAAAAGEGEHEGVALARRLRAEAATHALPIVFIWERDERSLRGAASNVGADDYFSLEASPAELLARLDSLFWRIETDRRRAPVVGEQRMEIDNFMFLLDSVREDVRAGTSGTMALVYAAVAGEGGQRLDKPARDRTLAEAHGYLKLNLRRIDSVAFYGPTTLLVYLPRMDSQAAAAALSRLHAEFLQERPGSDIAIGLASFPEHGSDVESLIESAEEAVKAAQDGSSAHRVVVYRATAAAPAETLAPAPAETLATAAALPATPAPAALDISPAAVMREPSPQRSETPAGAPAYISDVRAEAQPERARAERQPEKAAAAAPASHGGVSANGPEAARAASEAAAHERERRASGAIMPRRLLLTISDAARMAQLNSLIRSAGYEARAAFDGQQALDLLRIERPDLLVLDYDLHGINGVETIRRLRKQSGGRLSLPIVLLVPSSNESVRREALELGARSVVTTPYDPVELLASVRIAGSVE